MIKRGDVYDMHSESTGLVFAQVIINKVEGDSVDYIFVKDCNCKHNKDTVSEFKKYIKNRSLVYKYNDLDECDGEE